VDVDVDVVQKLKSSVICVGDPAECVNAVVLPSARPFLDLTTPSDRQTDRQTDSAKGTQSCWRVGERQRRETTGEERTKEFENWRERVGGSWESERAKERQAVREAQRWFATAFLQ
jgi:hypothetical protein